MYLDIPETLWKPNAFTMFSCLVLLALPIASLWCYSKLKGYRRIYSNLPSPKRSFFFGSLVELDKYMSPDRHGGTCFMNSIYLPSNMFKIMDWRRYMKSLANLIASTSISSRSIFFHLCWSSLHLMWPSKYHGLHQAIHMPWPRVGP